MRPPLLADGSNVGESLLKGRDGIGNVGETVGDIVIVVIEILVGDVVAGVYVGD